MPFTINYLTDDTGEKTAVQISIRDWNALLAKQRKLEAYKNRKSELTNAFTDIKLFEAGVKKLKSAQQLLNEL